jgi:polysaccharide export outer membrane protein
MNRMAIGRARLLWLLAGVALVSCAAGCGGRVQPPPADPTALSAEELAPPEGYRLRPGDIVTVRFPLVLKQSMDYESPVTPSGTLSLPYGDEIVAAGRTTKELAAEISTKMSQYLRDPFVLAVISHVAPQPVFVLGEVASPGRRESTDNFTISAALAQSGGILRTGKASSVMVIRTTGVSEPVAFKVDVRKILSGRDLSQDIVLRPNDVVYVPKSVIGKVDEFVDLFFAQIAPAQMFYLHGYDMMHLEKGLWR